MCKITNIQPDYDVTYIIKANRKLTIDEKKKAIVKYVELHPEVDQSLEKTIEFRYRDIFPDE